MRNRYLALLAALTMLAASTSCASENSSSGSVSSASGTEASTTDTSSSAETAPAPAESSGEITEAPADDPPAMDAAYEVLDCLDVPGTPSEICSCGNNAVIRCLSADEDDRLVVKYYVVDAVNDKLLRTIENCGPFETLLGIDAEGTVTAQDNQSGDKQKLIYYKANGSRSVIELHRAVDILKCGAAGQLYDLDSGIVRLYSDGSRENIFCNDETEGVELYDAKRNRAVADYCSESFTVSREMVLIDPSTGKEIAELGAASGAFANDAGDYIAVISTSDQDSSEQVCSVFEKDSGRLSGTYSLKDRNTDHSFSAGSSYGIAAERPEGSADFVFDFLRLSDGATGRISADIPDARRAISTGITSADRFLSAVVTGEQGQFRVRLVMTDPGQADFDGALDKTEPVKYPEEKDYKCGEKYKELRAEADSIEEKYGVRILLGDEVLNIKDIDNICEIVSDESSTASKYAFEYAGNAVKTLDDMLGRYPEGFFEKFKRNGKGGLCIALCDSFKNSVDEYGFAPGGVTRSFGAWEIIAIAAAEVDSQTGNIIHHEMFHAVEDIVSRRFSGIMEAEWDCFNPEGFSYTGDPEDYYEGSSDHIYGYDEDPYFFNEYGKVDSLEDRATLIEALFSDAYSASSDGYIEDVINKYPHLRDKYKYLGEWTAPFFGYVYWEKMLGIEL
ncbi:MAG: hypothetical protein IKN17_11995 [Ruminococcus sp.]|nr:hypothetical protein [Ruminococcus sp.]